MIRSSIIIFPHHWLLKGLSDGVKKGEEGKEKDGFREALHCVSIRWEGT